MLLYVYVELFFFVQVLLRKSRDGSRGPPASEAVARQRCSDYPRLGDSRNRTRAAAKACLGSKGYRPSLNSHPCSAFSKYARAVSQGQSHETPKMRHDSNSAQIARYASSFLSDPPPPSPPLTLREKPIYYFLTSPQRKIFPVWVSSYDTNHHNSIDTKN